MKWLPSLAVRVLLLGEPSRRCEMMMEIDTSGIARWSLSLQSVRKHRCSGRKRCATKQVAAGKVAGMFKLMVLGSAAIQVFAIGEIGWHKAQLFVNESRMSTAALAVRLPSPEEDQFRT
jgi:hypothetical protein